MLPPPESPPTLYADIAPLLVLKSNPLAALTVTVLSCTAAALFKRDRARRDDGAAAVRVVSRQREHARSGLGQARSPTAVQDRAY